MEAFFVTGYICIDEKNKAIHPSEELQNGIY